MILKFYFLESEEHLRIFQNLEAIITTLAFIFAGFWGYVLFVKKRQKYPHANINHEISHFFVNDKIFLRVKLLIKNIGEVRLRPVSSITQVEKVIPWDTEGIELRDDHTTEAELQRIDEKELKIKKGNREVEPGETDEILFDFFIGRDLEIIQIYSNVSDKKLRKKFRSKEPIVWHFTSLYRVEKK